MSDALNSERLPSTPSATASAATSNYRWVICALLFWVTTANYIDRGVFGNLAPELQKEIGWTQGQYWFMTVAFNAAYAISLLVAGRMMDVLGLRWGFTLACAFWGLASMSHALVISSMTSSAGRRDSMPADFFDFRLRS